MWQYFFFFRHDICVWKQFVTWGKKSLCMCLCERVCGCKVLLPHSRCNNRLLSTLIPGHLLKNKWFATPQNHILAVVKTTRGIQFMILCKSMFWMLRHGAVFVVELSGPPYPPASIIWHEGEAWCYTLAELCLSRMDWIRITNCCQSLSAGILSW